jgi:hypothetical protein
MTYNSPRTEREGVSQQSDPDGTHWPCPIQEQEGRFRVLAIVEFSREMATGKSASGYIENGNWQQVEPQSVNQALWDTVCKST